MLFKPTIPLLGISPTDLLTKVSICTRKVIAALLVIAKVERPKVRNG